MMKSFGVLVGPALLILTACQTGQPFMRDESFRTLWSAYDHCQSGADLDAMRADVKRLEEGSQTAKDNGLSVKHEPARPFLRPIERWIAPPITRLSVDPKAMAAACTLYTGEAAARFGRTDLAADLFTSVIAHYPQPMYAYYVDQAQRWLGDVTFRNAGLTSVSHLQMDGVTHVGSSSAQAIIHTVPPRM